MEATLANARDMQNFPTTVCLTCQSIGGDTHCMTGEASASSVLIIIVIIFLKMPILTTDWSVVLMLRSNHEVWAHIALIAALLLMLHLLFVMPN